MGSTKSDIEKEAKRGASVPVIINKVKKGGAAHHGGSWKVAYADFVTAMMAFFLLMWLITQVPEDKKAAISVYFQSDETRATSGVKEPTDFDPMRTNVEAKRIRLEDMQKLQYGLMALLKQVFNEHELQRNIALTPDKNGVLLRVNSDSMFHRGSAVLTQDSHFILDQVIQILKKYNYNMIIRGHTDDEEAPNSVYGSKWELSAARAAVATRYLTDRGIDPNHLRAVGYADTQPLVPNTSQENRGRNRRIEFYYLMPGMDAEGSL